MAIFTGKGGKMRCIILLVILSGCGSLSGTWSHTSKTMSVTIKLKNGDGELCVERGGKVSGLSVTHSGDVITVNDSEIIIKFIGRDIIVLGVDGNSDEDLTLNKEKRFKWRDKSCIR